MSETIGIIGLGKIARHHLRALEMTPGVQVIGGFDLDTSRSIVFREERRPVFGSVDELLDSEPSSVIVATPSPTHHEICSRVLAHASPPRRLIVEKPISGNLPDVEDLLVPDRFTEVVGVYHAAHAPEVLWAMDRWPAWTARFGEVVELESSFADPYRDLDEADRKVYGNSWIDSGINALSVHHRFVVLQSVEKVTLLDDQGSLFEASVRFASEKGSRSGTVRTTWDVSKPAKYSEFNFESGAILHLDHQEMSGTLLSADCLQDEFRYGGDLPRLQLHYLSAFRSIFVDRGGYYLNSDSLLLHRLLFSPAAGVDLR